MWKYCFLVQKNCNSSNDNDNSNSNKTINSEQIQYSFSQLFKSIKNIKKSCPSSWPASTWSGLPNQGVKLSKSNSGRRDPSRLRLSICFQVNHRNPVALSITCTNFAPKGPKCCSRFVKLLLQPRFPLNLKWCLWGFCWLQKLVVKTTPFNRILTVYILCYYHEPMKNSFRLSLTKEQRWAGQYRWPWSDPTCHDSHSSVPFHRCGFWK